jgi:hypothetical protein
MHGPTEDALNRHPPLATDQIGAMSLHIGVSLTTPEQAGFPRILAHIPCGAMSFNRPLAVPLAVALVCLRASTGL